MRKIALEINRIPTEHETGQYSKCFPVQPKSGMEQRAMTLNITPMMRCIAVISLFFCVSNQALAQSAANSCSSSLDELNVQLQSGYRKINIMPTLAPLVVEVRKTYEEAKQARDRGDLSECVRLANLGIRYATW